MLGIETLRASFPERSYLWFGGFKEYSAGQCESRVGKEMVLYMCPSQVK